MTADNVISSSKITSSIPYHFLQTKQKRQTAKRLSIESQDARQTGMGPLQWSEKFRGTTVL
jgi:hypothetical protein